MTGATSLGVVRPRNSYGDRLVGGCAGRDQTKRRDAHVDEGRRSTTYKHPVTTLETTYDGGRGGAREVTKPRYGHDSELRLNCYVHLLRPGLRVRV